MLIDVNFQLFSSLEPLLTRFALVRLLSRVNHLVRSKIPSGIKIFFTVLKITDKRSVSRMSPMMHFQITLFLELLLTVFKWAS